MLSLLVPYDGVFVFLSPNISLINFESKGFNFFWNIGIAFKLYTADSNSFSLVYHCPNIEFGFSYCFP